MIFSFSDFCAILFCVLAMFTLVVSIPLQAIHYRVKYEDLLDKLKKSEIDLAANETPSSSPHTS